MTSPKNNNSNQIIPAKLIGRDETIMVERAIPDEVPVLLSYNGLHHIILFATPGDLLDLVYGYSFSEKIIESIRDILSIEVKRHEGEIKVLVTLNEPAFARYEARHMQKTGADQKAAIQTKETRFNGALPLVSSEPVALVYREVIAAVAEFQQLQPIRRVNHSVHGAAWVGRDGEFECVREDVGRHNALDKLIGAMLVGGVSVQGGYGLLSSRASAVMVAKAVGMGMPALVSLYAPTSLAVRIAKAANLTLCHWSRDGLIAF